MNHKLIVLLFLATIPPVIGMDNGTQNRPSTWAKVIGNIGYWGLSGAYAFPAGAIRVAGPVLENHILGKLEKLSPVTDTFYRDQLLHQNGPEKVELREYSDQQGESPFCSGSMHGIFVDPLINKLAETALNAPKSIDDQTALAHAKQLAIQGVFIRHEKNHLANQDSFRSGFICLLLPLVTHYAMTFGYTCIKGLLPSSFQNQIILLENSISPNMLELLKIPRGLFMGHVNRTILSKYSQYQEQRADDQVQAAPEMYIATAEQFFKIAVVKQRIKANPKEFNVTTPIQEPYPEHPHDLVRAYKFMQHAETLKKGNDPVFTLDNQFYTNCTNCGRYKDLLEKEYAQFFKHKI